MKRILRPLLNVSKNEIYDFAKKITLITEKILATKKTIIKEIKSDII
jgi:adenylyl- and sulfurtransferase ThiI